MHLDTEQIQRLLHSEIDPGQIGALQAHVAQCARCEDRLERAAEEEAEIFSLLHALDHPTPPLTAGAVAARAVAGGRRARLTAAALTLLLVGAGVVYALPGSTLSGVSDRVRAWIGAGAASRGTTAGAYASGVAVVPGSSMNVVFEHAQEEGGALVRLADDAELSVRALGEPVRFEVDVDRILIANEGAHADYEILVPRAAPAVRIFVGRSVVFRKEAEEVLSILPPDAEGAFPVSLGLAEPSP